jgi:hypothetical protein
MRCLSVKTDSSLIACCPICNHVSIINYIEVVLQMRLERLGIRQYGLTNNFMAKVEYFLEQDEFDYLQGLIISSSLNHL